MDYKELKAKYPVFIYDSYLIKRLEGAYEFKFFYTIEGLEDFTTTWTFPCSRNIDGDILSRFVFNLGMVEAISYWKITCSPKFIIKCGILDSYSKNWWKKLFFNGLGEFQYINNILFDMNSFIEFKCKEEPVNKIKVDDEFKGYLVPVGGGKDSVVSLELLKDERVVTYAINENDTISKVIDVFSTSPDNKYFVKRILDKKILDFNQKGFLNGHIPFSSVVAFSSVIGAYINKIKYIALSNEASANESTVLNSFVNHQYSKSYEFECDFNEYISHLFDMDIHYFSLLRPLLEIQIAKLFSEYKQYHQVFRSCNRGSKKGIWCCECSKCLFVYIILSPFLKRNELVQIFGENLLSKKSLEDDFLALTGIIVNKPFECVGTRREVMACLKDLVLKDDDSYLVRKYKDIISDTKVDLNTILSEYNTENNLTETLDKMLRGKLNIEN